MDCATKLQPAQASQARNRGEIMVEPEDVAAVVRLHEPGWGARRIAAELGIARNTVRRYLRQGGWQPYQRPRRAGILDGGSPARSSSMPATPTSSARNSLPSSGSSRPYAPSSAL